MSFRLSEEMMEEIAVSTVAKGKSILLVKSEEQAVKVAQRVREAIEAELPAGSVGRSPKLKPATTNPSFVQLTNGGWVFIWPADDMGANDEMGQPEIVYWPSEGGNYEKVSYNLWRTARLAGEIWRPVTVSVPKKSQGRPTSWERLLSDEDE